ncbi:MAG TPA: hypothetical protein PKA64_02975 [Myxococcota bacterium]|nr:hypothetical protein [Myxococcota bacterium]
MSTSGTRIAAATLGLGASFALGVVVGRSGAPPVVEPAAAPPAPEAACVPSEDDLRVACIPFMRAGSTSLQEAEIKVEALSYQVREKQTEVHHLEHEVQQGSTTADDLNVRLEQARAELQTLQGQLQEALAARTQLEGKLGQAETQLARTQSELTTEKQRASDALDEATDQRWTAFVNDAQLTLCREGNRERLTACRAAVDAALSSMARDYKGCVRSGQATPELKQGSSREALPEFSQYLDQSNAFTRDWYVLFCDPDLPEATGNSENPKKLEDPRYFRDGGQKRPVTTP